MRRDPAADRIARLFRRQAATAIQRKSPLYTVLLGRVAEDVLAGGPTLAVLRPHAGERSGQALPLRFMAATHRLALSGSAERLAAHLPSTGGDGSADGAWTALIEVVTTRREELGWLLRRPLQTNEPGRSSALVTGFLAVAVGTRMPLRTLELGASAGLNLNWHRYRFESAAGALGDPRAELRYDCAPWPSPFPAALHLIEARGCDASPLDPRSADDRLTLRSAVWADQSERLAQLDAALEIAQHHPPLVERADALEWLQAVEARPGAATVVFHSIFEQYLDPGARDELASAMTRRLQDAATDAPVAWLSLERPTAEGARGMAELRLALSPDPARRLLGHAGYHGSPVRMSADADVDFPAPRTPPSAPTSTGGYES